MSSKKDKNKQKAKEKEQKNKNEILKGMFVRKPEEGAKATPVIEPREKVPGKKNIKSSKFEVSKDERTGSYCMDPVDKETGKRIAP